MAGAPHSEGRPCGTTGSRRACLTCVRDDATVPPSHTPTASYARCPGMARGGRTARPRRPAFPDMSWLGGNLNAVGPAITPIEARSKSVAGPSTPPIMGRCRDLRAGWRFSSVTAG